MRLLSEAYYCNPTERIAVSCSSLGPKTAFAREELYFDFCVAERWATVCGTANEAPEDILVTISFDYPVDGRSR
jgi:hypothetical protein